MFTNWKQKHLFSRINKFLKYYLHFKISNGIATSSTTVLLTYKPGQFE
jgi:hypothetical protein